MLEPGGSVVEVVVLCGVPPAGVLEVLEVGTNDCKVGGNVGTTGGGRVSGARLPGVLELVVVLELLEESGPSGDLVLVVELEPEIVEVVPGKVVAEAPTVVVVELLLVDAIRTVVELVPLGQPPPGAGIRSPSWSPCPLRLLASTVIVT